MILIVKKKFDNDLYGLEGFHTNADIGYILEIDFPGELHDLHKNYPFAPESIISKVTKPIYE